MELSQGFGNSSAIVDLTEDKLEVKVFHKFDRVNGKAST